ncbi:LrgB family protein [Oceanobacillus halophilus]|uniref:LrgB family protein n=1 Tax=Oceanobacillus halophilus TaxID=930130 RepID=A0A495A265_9BACI|nr:LrgB family protein [Oceanobacillus halophilus]RKQ33532.1 LrgB family protein [Oceanobacillus halophilus]
MTEFFIGIITILITILIYHFSVKIHKKWDYPFTLPILISTFVIIIGLLFFDIPYDTYLIGGDWISQLLGPAVVALAYPLYNNRHLLKKLMIPVISGTFLGAIVGITTGIALAKWAGFENEIIYTISSKSVTTPVSMAITDSIGGITPLAAVFVMIAGISGAVLSQYIFKYAKINHYLGKGIALGSASHAIGTATALENSEIEGSISSIAMIISAIVVSILTPWLLHLFL